jgi:hypothetical protein
MDCPRILERDRFRTNTTGYHTASSNATHRYLLLLCSRSFTTFVIHQIFNTPLGSNQHSIIVRITCDEAMHRRPSDHHRVVLYISVGYDKKENNNLPVHNSGGGNIKLIGSWGHV